VIGVILGSGLGGVADVLEDRTETTYADLPGFPRTKAEGHAGVLVRGYIGRLQVACCKGRVHVYDGASPHQLGALPRGLHELGCDTLLITNAAGSLAPEHGPGSLVAICDHINLQGLNPLIGEPHFVSLRDAYDPELRGRLHAAADAVGVPLGEGVYLAVSGPSFETPAEIRAFRTLGADLVGMSTVPEVIVARHLGMRVAAVSVVTNLAEGMGGPQLSHEQTLAEAERGSRDLVPVLQRFLEDLETGVRH